MSGEEPTVVQLCSPSMDSIRTRACPGHRVNDAHLVVDQIDHSDAGKVLDERLADGGV